MEDWDFPGGPVVKNLLSNAADVGSSPSQGTKIPYAAGQRSPCATTWAMSRPDTAIDRVIGLSQVVQFSRSVVSDSLQPHRLQHARLPYPSPTPGACSAYKLYTY